MEKKISIIILDDGGATRRDFQSPTGALVFLMTDGQIRFTVEEIRDTKRWMNGNEPGAILDFRMGWIIIRESGL